MTLIPLAREIMDVFEKLNIEDAGKISKIKFENLRDVVTELDLDLHKLVSDYCAKSLPGTLFLSEENSDNANIWERIVRERSILVVDPLDGSNNLACGLQEYGFMATILTNGKFSESLIILPNENQMIRWNSQNGVLFSKDVLHRELVSATAYLAYPPRLSHSQIQTRTKIMSKLDTLSAGVYRYGSAALGLYRTAIGAHSTFVGLDMRPWDVISYFPILKSLGASVTYSASSEAITILVSKNIEIFTAIKGDLSSQIGEFVDFAVGDELRLIK